MIVSPVSFLFADNHRISFVGGEQTLTNIVSSLYTAAEEHYGTIAVRLYTAFKAQTQNESKFRKLCGVPVLVELAVISISFTISLVLLVQYFNDGNSSFLIGAIVFGCIFGIFMILPVYIFTVRMFVNLPQRRVKRLTHRVNQLPFERLVQKLQAEVDLLTSMITSLNAFTNSQTRLMIMVDGLDSCDQNSMVQILDALSLFFGARQNAPYILVIAADPNIIVNALQNNMRGAGTSEITGHDYMKNVIRYNFNH